MDDVHGKAKYFDGLGKKQKRTRKKGSPEQDLQIQCVKWFGMQYSPAWRLLFMVKNDGHKKFAINEKTGKRYSFSAQQDSRAGLVPGVSDLQLAIPNGKYHGAFIELKTPQGRVRPSQKEFEKVVDYFNYKYVVIRSLDEFISFINDYLKSVDVTKIPQGGLGEDQKDFLRGAS